MERVGNYGKPYLIICLAGLLLGPAAALAQPANDDCVDAIPINDGSTAFSTSDATTDGPAHGTCEHDGQTYNDIWFVYTATCTGDLTVSTCGTAFYDTDLVVYDGCDCGSLTLLGCDDDTSGCPGFTSEVTVFVTEGNCYLIRVGGFQINDQGSGNIVLTCDNGEPSGACCLMDDSCVVVGSEGECQAMSGDWRGLGTDCAFNPCGSSNGADVVYSNCQGIENWGAIGGIRGYSLGTYTCNIGDVNLQWGGVTPLFGMNAYRMDLDTGRLEQIGMSWLKNGTTAAAGSGCGLPCSGQGGSVLGAGCLDVYGPFYNGGHSRFGPRSDVNAFTGDYPGPSGGSGNAIYKRLQIREADLDHSNALYFLEGVYVAPDDAANGNAMNNASYQRFVVGNNFDLTPTDAMQQGIGAIFAWQDHGGGLNVPDASVEIVNADVPNEGRFHVASKVTDLGGGQWRYDYAIFNLNSHRSAGSVKVPIAAGTNVTNIGFHDVDYHSGEPFDNTDWNNAVNPTSVIWSSPQSFAQNPNSNALRFGTMYNFSFDADKAPAQGIMTIGLFRPGSPTDVFVDVPLPLGGGCPGDCVADGSVDGNDIQSFVNCILGLGGNCLCADLDGGGAGASDIPVFVNALLAGSGCP
ncbi:MAG: hypothetical protein MI923_25185 [Phycisphaerales bacterium]|nr:hypothetical protein [Phycisphaerales bacterium]